jgi:hypothetical protein
MATTYVVLLERMMIDAEDEHSNRVAAAIPWGDPVEATNAEQARRRVAERMDEADLEAGVTLIAVPERSWRTGRGALKAETTRRIRPA